MEIPKEVLEIMEALEKNHFECYLVGGCVRDFYLRKSPKDYDITTNATPLEMINCFKNFKVIQTNLNHNTLTVINTIPIEVTTFKGIDLENDLLHRDFTFNALAYNQKVFDYYQGLLDLNNQIIRCVKNPIDRFNEDPLRILRALRFSAVLGFDIESETKKAIFNLYPLLKEIKKERIRLEFTKILLGNYALKILEEYKVIIEFVSTTISLDKFLSLPNKLELKLASLYYQEETIKLKEVLTNLTFSNRTTKKVIMLINNLNANQQQINRLLLKYNKDDLLDLLILKKTFNSDLFDYFNSLKITSINQLNINGKDLMALGYQTKMIKTKLEEIFLKVIEGKIENNFNSIVFYLQESQ